MVFDFWGSKSAERHIPERTLQDTQRYMYKEIDNPSITSWLFDKSKSKAQSGAFLKALSLHHAARLSFRVCSQHAIRHFLSYVLNESLWMFCLVNLRLLIHLVLKYFDIYQPVREKKLEYINLIYFRAWKVYLIPPLFSNAF